MLSTSFESALKENPPPHPGDERSTKKVKLRDCNENIDTMDAECSPLSLQESHVSPTQGLEFIPETPLLVPFPTLAKEDNQMIVDKQPAGKTPVSFKDTLLNSGQSFYDEEEEVMLGQGDVLFGMNDNIPSVNFIDRVLNVLNQRMGFALIVKLLGRSIGIRQMRTQLRLMWKPNGKWQATDLEEECFFG